MDPLAGVPPDAPPTEAPGTAIAALVLGVLATLVGLLPVVSLLAFPMGLAGVVCAVLALRRLSRGAPGRGLAGAGFALSALGLAAATAWTVALLTTGLWDDVSDVLQAVVEPDATEPFSLEPGDCFDDPPGDPEMVRTVVVVACDGPHDNEAIAVTTYPHDPAEPYPGDDAVIDYGFEYCEGDAFTDYVGARYADSQYFVDFFYPDKRAWGFGDRDILCFVHSLEPTTGSARGARQ